MKRIICCPIALAVSAFSTNTFFYNQVGYDTGSPVSIIVQSSDNLEGTKWTLFSVPADPEMLGNSVTSGTFEKGENPDNWLSSGKYYTVNLGNKLPAGNYYISVNEGSPSTSDYFSVGNKALATGTLASVLNYFYNDRATNPSIVSEDSKVPVYGNSTTKRDVHGGWYDASGDASKYFSHLSYANYLNPQQIPLTVWSLAFAAERIPTLLAATTTKASTADEAAYGADFLVRMLDEQGFFYMTVFDTWGQSSRALCAFSGSNGIMSADYQTAFREGGGMAIAALARVSTLGVSGDFTSEEYLDAAQKAYAHLSSKQSIGGSCAYCDDGKENIIDDYTALLAATELFFATNGKGTYMTDMEKRAANLAERISNDGYFWSDDAKTRPFWHASDAGLPIIALMRFLEAEMRIEREPCPANADCSLDPAEIAIRAAHKAINKHLTWLLSITDNVENPFGYARQTYKTQGSIKDGFFIPHDNESDYWWQGEDARIASLSAAALYAQRGLGLNNQDAVNKFSTDQLDWILGKNPYGVCMMHKKGKNNPSSYSGQSSAAKTLEGGIANGISGKNTDGSGIVWDNVNEAGLVGSWNNWRWIEQWLPHSTWYLMALAVRYDEKTITVPFDPLDIKKNSTKRPSFSISQQGRTVTINATPASTKVTVTGIDGQTIISANLKAGHTTLDLAGIQSGIYFVKVDGAGARKVIIH